ncbi:hypothetical protein [Candidatus Absconditicoccus praedator]|uniref:hypothetical protein n=1 Tax=Candidatus Absconditicoccus praedator TaxID=2735562 RepID=UPI001E387689|nr:hypothetical protein [Candidatus Absconditicoccus praedator]UFX83006.1 hypothetical protein HLG78_02625 [Candidatus Absconditicoccus praedator]
MKNLFEKKLNKFLVGGVIGTAILGLGGFGMSPKGRGFFKKLKDKITSFLSFFGGGVIEMKKIFKKKK